MLLFISAILLIRPIMSLIYSLSETVHERAPSLGEREFGKNKIN